MQRCSLLGWEGLTVLFMTSMNLHESVMKLKYRTTCPYFWPWKSGIWRFLSAACWCVPDTALGVVPYLTSGRDRWSFQKKSKKWFQINIKALSRPKFADFEERHCSTERWGKPKTWVANNPNSICKILHWKGSSSCHFHPLYQLAIA